MGRGAGVHAATANSIEITFEYQAVRCRERIKLAPTSSNLKYAAKLKSSIEVEIAKGSFDYFKFFPKSKRARRFSRNPAQTITVGEILTEYLTQAKTQLEPETYGDYSEFIRNIWRPRFGTWQLSALNHDAIETWVAEQTASRKRILNVLIPLRQAVRYAVKRKYLAIDPIGTVSVKRPRKAKARSLIDPFESAEVNAVLKQMEPQVAHLFQFWAWTGLREGELIALRWDAVDLKARTARIERAARGRRIKAPKTLAGERTIKLLPGALDALQRQRAYTQAERREVFLMPASDSLRGRNKKAAMQPWGHDKPIRNRWREACEKAGVRYRFPRQLRHTFGTWMIQAGESLRWVSEQMGHEDETVTLKHYSKWLPSLNEIAGNKAASMFSDAKLASVTRA